MSRRPVPGPFARAIGELQELQQRLDRASDARRAQLYARCVALLEHARELNQPPLPGRKVRALILESGWHLRCMAGLDYAGNGNAGEHTAWAERSLADLAAWSERHPSA